MRKRNLIWRLYPQLSKYVNPPNGNLRINIAVENLLNVPIYFSKIEIYPSWANAKKGVKLIQKNNYLSGGTPTSLTDFKLQLPSKVGLYTLKFGLETWVYDNYRGSWKKLGVLQTSEWKYIQVTPQPIYDAFVSYSGRNDDSPIVNQILNLLRLWGFRPILFGKDKFSEDPLKIPSDISRLIDRLPAVIGIATPRDYSLQEKIFKTFPWFHIESTMAFKSDKPLLFIIDEAVKSEGFLEYPNFPKVFYNPAKIDVLEHRLAVVMPGFRERIAKKKTKSFLSGLGKAALITGGIWLVGKLSVKDS